MSEEKNNPKKKDKQKYPPNLYPNSSGKIWIVDFTWQGERYRDSLGPVSLSVAKERANSAKVGVAEGRVIVNGKRWNGQEWVVEAKKKKIEDPLFNLAMDRYLEFSKSTHEPTTHKTTVHFTKPLRDFFGKKRLSEISNYDVEKYRIERRKVCECPPTTKKHGQRCKECGRRYIQLTDATINHELIVLKAMFKKSVNDWETAEKDPTKATKLVKLKNERTRYLTQAEAQRLLNACNEDFRDVVLTAMHTGLRSKEIRTLRWQEVDLINRFITVRASYSKNKDTKSVPMTKDLYKMFVRVKAERDRKTEDLVFLSRYGKPWKSWRTAFENARMRAKISDFHFHDLRHCFASWLAMQGTAKKSMMELLGHRDPSMTDRYTHLSVDYNRTAVSKLPAFNISAPNPPQNPPHEEESTVVEFRKSL